MFLPFQTFSYDHFCLKAVFTFCWFLKTWHFPQDLDNCDQKLFQPLNFGSISELRSHCSNVKYFRITTTISQSYYNPSREFSIVFFLKTRNKTENSHNDILSLLSILKIFLKRANSSKCFGITSPARYCVHGLLNPEAILVYYTQHPLKCNTHIHMKYIQQEVAYKTYAMLKH